MPVINWPPQHSEALREYLLLGMSYSLIADAINARFGTRYSRSAAIGRAKRMNLSGSAEKTESHSLSKPRAPRLHRAREDFSLRFTRRAPVFEVTETAPLRCAEVTPRHLSLADLGRRDCRYPYGGDIEGEAITFCGHRRQPGTSYCPAHFQLTRHVMPERTGEVAEPRQKVLA